MEFTPFLAMGACTVVALVLNWGLEQFFHNRRLNLVKHRIHVNGIRGKSTVTRIVAGMLRESNVKTVGKTTGSAACLIDECGMDHAIRRVGAPTILEQVEIIRGLPSDIEALVIECMAIKPSYQRICEEKIVRSNIGVLTNVREDHQEVLGQSIEAIAESLLSTCPKNGVLITSETNKQLIPLFRRAAEERNTKLIIATPDLVSDADVAAFPYVAFKENIAIGFALADLLGIERSKALKGMVAAPPDPGVLRIERLRHNGTNLVWADLFAVNDRESVIACGERVAKTVSSRAIKIGLLNNRSDREHRAIQFAKIAANDLDLDFIALLGAYDRQVESQLIQCGVSPERIIRAGEQRGIQGQAFVSTLLSRAEGKEVVLLGLVNIHTHQAESLRDWFQSQEGFNHESR